jgi:hypothetical protein
MNAHGISHGSDLLFRRNHLNERGEIVPVAAAHTLTEAGLVKLTFCGPSDVAKEITIAQDVVSDWNIQHGELRKRKLVKACPHKAHLDRTLESVV